MVATARGWLPAEQSWPRPVNAAAGDDGPRDDDPTAGWWRQLADERSRHLAEASQGQPHPADGAHIRKRVGEALGALAGLVEPALTAAVRRARQAWDQADALVVLDGRARAEIATLRRWLASRVATEPAGAAASALEGLLALDAAVALVRLFERRLAALLRLQLRSGDPELLPRGRPFLDLAAALREAERAWR